LIASGLIASLGVIGSHFAGDFFLGIDIMVTAMMVNFLLMCLTLISLPITNPVLASGITTVKKRSHQLLLGWTGSLLLCGFLIIHVSKDLTATVEAWYFHSTWVWLIVMALGSVVFFVKMSVLKKSGIDVDELFKNLPD